MSNSYHIEDEPRPSSFSSYTVQPMWPLLGMMLGGCWLGWPWFVFNSLAVGSPSAKRELRMVGAAFAVTVAFTAVIFWLDRQQLITKVVAELAWVALAGWKLTCGYRLQTIQTRSVELHQYFGGAIRNGSLLAMASFMLRSSVLAQLPPFWVWVFG